jgi:CRISPR-associated endonuclease/helicase Cas3
LMCGEHRSQVIGKIKERLRERQPTRVVSTQLVEAGVDLDFPVVYRALAGLDSIAQAAGRCNREGRLADGRLGKVVVFAPPKAAPAGLLRKGADATKEMFRCFPELVSELPPDAFRKYFNLFYSRVVSFDAAGVMDLLDGPDARAFQIQFRSAAHKFQLIDDAGQRAIVVWYKAPRFDSRELFDELKRFGPRRKLMRRLQRCTVTVPERAWASLRDQGAIAELTGPDGPLGVWAQCVPELYDPTFGVRLEGPTFQGDEFIC